MFGNSGSVKPIRIVRPMSRTLGAQQRPAAQVADRLGDPQHEEPGEEPRDADDLHVGDEAVPRPLGHPELRAAELKRAVEDLRRRHRIQAQEDDPVVHDALAHRSRHRPLRGVAVVDVRDLVQHVDRRPHEEDRQQDLQVHERHRRDDHRQRERRGEEAAVPAPVVRLHERVGERRVQVRAADEAGDDEVDRRLRDAEPMKEDQRDRDERGAEDEDRQVPAWGAQPDAGGGGGIRCGSRSQPGKHGDIHQNLDS